ncbi:NAD-binding protein [candidate division KSB3 bacterium]|uniref:NAD-binding protein n=1 Tax=candidate division KSB3 bacterium TaxID=2044937 RepID=A0A2G6KBW3_9BACT|nr:MAG: NAD-binding protein [candidate division KSB3 bacterium]
MAKVKWGIISTAKIARLHVIPGMQAGNYSEVYAIASRDFERAQQTAQELSIPKAYGSYEELFADPDVQAVYNPLPNHLHVPWSIKAAEAGKHVLCEKPMGVDAADAQQLVDACQANGVLLMEAFMYRMHPQWVMAKEYVTSGKLGELKAVQVFFSYMNLDPENIRNRSDFAGNGGLMDIGCYPISLARFLFGDEPKKVVALIDRDPAMEIDILDSAILQFEKGHATFTCSTQLMSYQRVHILGTEGRFEIEIPFNAPEYEPTNVYYETEDAGIETRTIATCHQYGIEGDLFSRAILDGTPVPTPPEDAVANMKVIDALFRSGKNGAWEEIV